MPSELAANLPALSMPLTSSFTPNVAAVEPVKNVLSPTPPVSRSCRPKMQIRYPTSPRLICSLPVRRYARRNAVDVVELLRQILSVVSSSKPSRSMLIVVVCVDVSTRPSPFFVRTKTSKLPLCGVNGRPAASMAPLSDRTRLPGSLDCENQPALALANTLC